jgi:16S rRNA processing protein RimM
MATSDRPPDRPGDRRVLIGVVVGAQGVRGQVRIKSFAALPRDVAAYGPLQDKAGRRRFEVKAEGFVRGAVIARIAGIADRDAAEALRGTELYVERGALPTPAEGEYYQADLIGLAAEDKAGATIGTVRGVEDYGAGPLLEIELAGENRTALVPFTKAVLVAVDLAGGRLVLDPPLGLLEEATEQDAAAEADGVAG